MANDLQTSKTDEFCELNDYMLKGSEVIVNNICEQAKELNICNEKLLIAQDKLKRINIFAHKRKIRHFPRIEVNRIADFLYLKAIFDHPLPLNTTIFVNLTSGHQTQFSSKLVDDREITVEMPLIAQMLESTLDLTIDLVTLKTENEPWCIIRNCIEEPTLREREKIRQILDSKKNFLNAKLSALQNIKQDGSCIDMKKLSSIKKSIRKEIPDL